MLSEARVVTHRPAVYLQRLCKHFAAKAPAEFDDQRGSVQFAMGACDLLVEPEALLLRAQAADEASLAQVQNIVGGHLERFGHHDRLQVDWSAAPALAA